MISFMISITYIILISKIYLVFKLKRNVRFKIEKEK
jgi:hypothetical protein